MFQIFVEGQGENKAGQKLVHRIVSQYSLGNAHFSEGRRYPKLHINEGLHKVIELARRDPATEGVLILRDDEDACPKDNAPKKAAFLRELKAPFPIAYCVLYREFETLFIACSIQLKGKTIPHSIRGNITFKSAIPSVDPEQVRGAKEWITRNMLDGGKVYKPTTDQLTFVEAIDLKLLQEKDLPRFGTLVRCIEFLITNRGASAVYPL
jgi:hypothetical protein